MSEPVPTRISLVLPQYVSVNLAAALTGHSPKYVRDLIKGGMLTALLAPGSRTRLLMSELEQLRLISPSLSAEDFLEAQRRFDRTIGATQRRYNATRRREKTTRRCNAAKEEQSDA